MVQLMPLPLTVSCFSKIQTRFTFLVPACLGSPGKRAIKRVCVCVCSVQLTSHMESMLEAAYTKYSNWQSKRSQLQVMKRT